MDACVCQPAIHRANSRCTTGRIAGTGGSVCVPAKLHFNRRQAASAGHERRQANEEDPRNGGLSEAGAQKEQAERRRREEGEGRANREWGRGKREGEGEGEG